MSTDKSDSADFRVEDSEGYVDRRRKENILNNREKVEEVAESVFPAAKRGECSQEYAAGMWHETVRNYLISIEPLLKDFDLPNAEEAYLHQPLGVVELTPPEQFQNRAGPAEIAQRGFILKSEPLEPFEETVTGLKDVIEKDEYHHTWEVRVNRKQGLSAKRQGTETVTVEESRPMPKVALMNAVRTADEFLQEANVGLALGKGRPTANYSE
jgi:hypothetical protein